MRPPDLARQFILRAITVVLVLLPVWSAADVQQPTRMYRIGVLTVESPELLRQSLREVGYTEGRNISLEVRDTAGDAHRADALAVELARLNVDVIVAVNPNAVFSARRATTTIPIVMVHTPDPVQLGLVASLAQPGGNITGVTSLSVDLSIKQLELIKELTPRSARIAVLSNPDNPWHPLVVKGLRDKERSLGVPLQFLEVRAPSEFDGAFQAMVRERTRGLLVLADPMTFAQRRRVADLATKQRLPLISGPRGYAEAGATMCYWADEAELYRKAASYVDRILKGASPGSLPIEQPTRYELIVNLTAAKALGVTIPPSLLLRATVIE